MLDFVPMWTLILGMGVFFYVLLDGFDLGVGTWYILRLMGKAPQPHESGVEKAPIRTAGITPGPTQNPTGGERLPDGEEDS